MSVTEESSRKYPKSAFACILLAYFFPVIFMGVYVIASGRLTAGQHKMILANPLMAVFQVIYFGLSILGIIMTVRSLKKYDPSEKGQKKMTITWWVVNYGQISYIILGGMLYCLVYGVVANRIGITTLHLPSYSMIWLGVILMWDMFFYIIWLEITESWINFVPFKKENMALNLIAKYGIVALFATLAMALLCLGPLIYPGYEGHSQKELFARVFPMAILGVILITIDFMLLVSATIRNVKAFNAFSQKLAEGDYTQEELKVITRDDFGFLVNSLNLFFSNTKSLLSNLQKSVVESNQAADDSTASMQNIASSVEQIVGSISKIQEQMHGQSAGVEEAAAIINEITGNIGDLNDSVAKQVTAVEESSAAVHEMVANIQSVTSILEKNSASTKELSVASEEGREGVQKAVEMADTILEDSKGLIEASNVVQDIANQTNLLAMNAAIEAAHAGELGKGFAVVADEIRKLAEQSNIQGKRITESLNNLENSIQGVSGSTRSLNEQFDRIFELTKIVQQQEEIVNNAMTEQAAGSNQIIAAMQHIDDATREVKEGAGSILEGSKQISIEMDMLAKTTVQTNENVVSMSQGARTITEAVKSGNEAAAKNSRSIAVITEEIGKFKL